MDPCATFTIHPTDADVGAWFGVGDESGGLSVLTAAEVGVVGSFDGIDRVDFTDGILLTIFGSGDGAWVRDAIDDHKVHGTMSVDEGSKSRGESEESSLNEHDS